MAQKNNKAIDQILDLLIDALNDRQQERESNTDADKSGFQPSESAEADSAIEATADPELDDLLLTNSEPKLTTTQSEDDNPKTNSEAESENESRSQASDEENRFLDEYAEYMNDQLLPEKHPPINMNKIFYRLSLSLVALIIFINIPFTFNQYRTTLATAAPDKRSLLIRDGLVFKGPGDEIYFLDEGEKRWISSLDAFELNGLSWEQVHLVDQTFVDQFKDGPDYHVLIRCNAQPHIYLLEGNEKRWIQNPFEFEKAGLEWENVRYISCRSLQTKYPDGDPIPPNAGDPPQW